MPGFGSFDMATFLQGITAAQDASNDKLRNALSQQMDGINQKLDANTAKMDSVEAVVKGHCGDIRALQEAVRQLQGGSGAGAAPTPRTPASVMGGSSVASDPWASYAPNERGGGDTSRTRPRKLVVGTFPYNTERKEINRVVELVRAAVPTGRRWGRSDAPFAWGRTGNIDVGHLSEAEIEETLAE